MKRRKQAHITFKKEKNVHLLLPNHNKYVWAIYGQFADRPKGFMYSNLDKKLAKKWLDAQLVHLKYSFIVYLNGRKIS